MPPRSVSISWHFLGRAGNAAEPPHRTLFGAVTIRSADERPHRRFRRLAQIGGDELPTTRSQAIVRCDCAVSWLTSTASRHVLSLADRSGGAVRLFVNHDQLVRIIKYNKCQFPACAGSSVTITGSHRRRSGWWRRGVRRGCWLGCRLVRLTAGSYRGRSSAPAERRAGGEWTRHGPDPLRTV